ncbi:hypothetical protein ACNQGB_04045 [Flavobacterium sp. XS1P32]|uniref:hypothetical protein n=1 Tax=Flavobacterium sp. XS1P32 TaxID=3401726 RepID=UPI003AAE8E28
MKKFIKKTIYLWALAIFLLLIYACTDNLENENITDSNSIDVKAIEAKNIDVSGVYDKPCYDVMNKSYLSKEGNSIQESKHVMARNSSRTITQTGDGLLIGMGYNPFTASYAGTPFVDSRLSNFGNESSATFYSVENNSEKISVINTAGTISFSGNIKPTADVRANFSGSYESNLSSNLSDTSNSFYMVGVIKVGLGKYVVGNTFANMTSAAQPYCDNNSVNGRTFTDLYGPYFISEEVLGGSLTVMLKVYYDQANMSYSDKQSFQAAASVKFFNSKASTEASYTYDSTMTSRVSNTQVEFKAYSNIAFSLPSSLTASTFSLSNFIELQNLFTTAVNSQSTKPIISMKYDVYNPGIFTSTIVTENGVTTSVRDNYIASQVKLAIQQTRSTELAEFYNMLMTLSNYAATPTINNHLLGVLKREAEAKLTESSNSLYYTTFDPFTYEQRRIKQLIQALPYVRVFSQYRCISSDPKHRFYYFISATTVANTTLVGPLFRGYDPTILFNSEISTETLNLAGFWTYNDFFGIYVGSPYTPFSSSQNKLLCCMPSGGSITMDWDGSVYRAINATLPADIYRFSQSPIENQDGSYKYANVIKINRFE